MATSRLTYPRGTVYEEHTDYVKFEFLKYLAPFGSKTKGDRSGGFGGTTGGTSEQLKYYNTSGNRTAEPSGLSSILLYMPEDIMEAVSAQWGEKSFTNTGRDLLAAGGALLDQGDIGSAVTRVAGALGGAGGRLPSGIAAAIAAGINALPGGVGGSVDLNDVLAGAKGIVLNPNVELLYEGYGLREFDLNFKFNPRDDKEAVEIRNIIRTFRAAALPSFGAGDFTGTAQDITSTETTKIDTIKNVNDNYISVPNLVQVTYMKGKSPHPYLPKWKQAVITDIQTSYTPDGSYATYSDGSPVATSLSLRFTETKLIFSDEVSQGY